MTAESPGPHIEAFFDPPSSTLSYLVLDPATRACALVDTVLDFQPSSGRTGTASADRMAARVAELGAHVEWLLETHVHADHLSAAAVLADRLGGRIGIGAGVTRVQRAFGQLFNAGPGFALDGSQFGHLFDDGEEFRIGQLQARALHTPGHTPACVSYLVGEAAFIGDTLFAPDYGSARADFPGGDARALYRSVRRLLQLPPATRLYLCHDYLTTPREPQPWVTVAVQRQANVHLRDGIGEDDFVAMRVARDATLEMPALMLHSVQVNMRAGRLPPPEDNGIRYLKIPLDRL